MYAVRRLKSQHQCKHETDIIDSFGKAKSKNTTSFQRESKKDFRITEPDW